MFLHRMKRAPRSLLLLDDGRIQKQPPPRSGRPADDDVVRCRCGRFGRRLLGGVKCYERRQQQQSNEESEGVFHGFFTKMIRSHSTWSLSAFPP